MEKSGNIEKKNKWKLMILPAALFLLAFGLYTGYSIWEKENDENLGNMRGISSAQGSGNEAVAVFQEETEQNDYRTVGSFISKFHTKYNDTLGWGRIDSVEWNEQREISSEILSVIVNIQTENPDLKSDLEAISNYSATIKDGSKDKKILLQLHRYFHDLDVEFNGYRKTNDYFNVTKYKYKESDNG